MSQIYFKPWIGINYQTGGIFNTKILVIGNNHYCQYRDSPCKNCGIDGGCFDRDEAGNPCCDFTINTVRDAPKAYRIFAKTLLGRETSDDEYTAVWDSLCFYNYLQTALPENDKYNSASYDEFYKESEAAFRQVLTECKPNKIITWGNKVWDEMPEVDIPLLGIMHPSANRFSWVECYENEVKGFLKK